MDSRPRCSAIIKHFSGLNKLTEVKKRTTIRDVGVYLPKKTPKPRRPKKMLESDELLSIINHDEDEFFEINYPNDEKLIHRLNNEVAQKYDNKLRKESKIAWVWNREYLDKATEAADEEKGSSKPFWKAQIKRRTNAKWNSKKDLTPPKFAHLHSQVRGRKKLLKVAVDQIKEIKAKPPMIYWTETSVNYLVADGAFLINYPYLGEDNGPETTEFENQLYALYGKKDYNSAITPKMPDEVFFDTINKYVSSLEDRRKNPMFKSAVMVKESLHSDTEPLQSLRKGIIMPVRSIFTAIATKYQYLGFPFELEERYVSIFHCKDKYITLPERQIITTGKTYKAMDVQPCSSKSITRNNAPSFPESVVRGNTSGCSNSKAKGSTPGCSNTKAQIDQFKESDQSVMAGKSETNEERRIRIRAEAAKYYNDEQESLSVMSKAFCSRCTLFGCVTHEPDNRTAGIQANEKLDPFLVNPKFKCSHPNCIRKRPKALVKKKKRGRQAQPLPWTDDEKFACSIMYEKERCFNITVCWISRCMETRTCSEVRDFIKGKYKVDPTIKEQKELGDEFYSEEVDEKALRSIESEFKGQTVAKTQALKRGPKREESIKVDEGALYKPCNHGPGVKCSPQNCSCAYGLTYCERWCFCPLDCERRFPGCRCKNGCHTASCPCLRAHRECDPTVCTKCKSEVGKYENGNCKNVAIMYRREKSVIVKKSFVAGWGGFIGCEVNKYEFIAEYCGELISMEESARRACFYNKINHTYLFSLNNSQVIDATRIGSKARFINSSKTPNCIPKVIMVNGDHRIGIYASRKLKEGEELFFDYDKVIKEGRGVNGSGKTRKSQSKDKCTKVPRAAMEDNKAQKATVVSENDSEDE